MLRLAIIIAIILYFLSPIDLLPDFLGPLGRLDDLGVIAFGLYHLRRLALRKAAEHAFNSKRTDKPGGNNDQQAPEQEPPAPPRSPLEVLELPQNASPEEIEKAYKRLAAQYHPDKVEHLGTELQELAHEKMVEITSAYEKLK